MADYIPLFPFAEYWWFYATFTLFVLGLLAAKPPPTSPAAS